MPNPSTPFWQTRLTAALHQDPKKTGVLAVLAVILMVMAGRLVIGQSHPALAAGSPIASGAGLSQIPGQIILPALPFKPSGSAASLREWISAPVQPIRRNIFVVKSEYFPQDAANNGASATATGFWSALAKSLSLQADQKGKRDAVIASFKVEAAALRPTSIVVGPFPRAMINGTLVREGDSVGGFRVLKIESHGIVVERGGIRLAVPMGASLK
jgi:hypothetical protein